MERGEEERGHTMDPSLTVQLGSGHRDDTAPRASAPYTPTYTPYAPYTPTYTPAHPPVHVVV